MPVNCIPAGLTLALYLLGIASLKDYYRWNFEENDYFYVSALVLWPFVETAAMLYVAYHKLFEKE